MSTARRQCSSLCGFVPESSSIAPLRATEMCRCRFTRVFSTCVRSPRVRTSNERDAFGPVQIISLVPAARAGDAVIASLAEGMILNEGQRHGLGYLFIDRLIYVAATHTSKLVIVYCMVLPSGFSAITRRASAKGQSLSRCSSVGGDAKRVYASKGAQQK